jgi:hypothetical protein
LLRVDTNYRYYKIVNFVPFKNKQRNGYRPNLTMPQLGRERCAGIRELGAMTCPSLRNHGLK